MKTQKEKNDLYAQFMVFVFEDTDKKGRETILKRLDIAHKQLLFHEIKRKVKE